MRSNSKFKFSLTALLLLLTTALLASCGGSAVTTTAAGTTPLAASITLSPSAASVKSDGSSTTTLTATVLASSNAVLQGQAVSFSASTGQLSIASGVTDVNGQLTTTYSAGPSGINRTATITAVSDNVSIQLPLQITGSTINATSSSNSISDNGTNSATITFTALNAGGNPVAGTAVTLTKSGVGNISYTPISGTTDVNGQLVVTVTGVTGGAGTATLTASALGATGAASVTVTSTTSTFGISGLTLNGTVLNSANTSSFSSTSMKIGDSLVVTVGAPAASSVTFATSMGVWNGGALNVVTIPVTAGTASATLTTNSAGIATVQVLDPLAQTSSDSLSVSMTATTPFAITLQASPSVVPKSSGGNTGTSTLIATVTDSNGLPVGDAPVAFSIINPTGGGENVSPVISYTSTTGTANLSLGQALTTFTAGSLSSGQNGIQVRAQVPGYPSVVTEAAGLSATVSGNDASIIIGGSAGSVAFGQATQLGVNSNASQYILAMSVSVADANGNPAPQGTLVNLSLWPIAMSTGTSCTPDPDYDLALDAAKSRVTWRGTFLNEDINENLILDGTEDGTRSFYATGTNTMYYCVPDPSPATTCTVTAITSGTGTKDTHITPANSIAGTVPSSVTTDANGVATFDLTYPKTSGIWTIVRIRGKTVVQGSDAVGEMQFRLGALKTDVSPCILPDSPYIF